MSFITFEIVFYMALLCFALYKVLNDEEAPLRDSRLFVLVFAIILILKIYIQPK